MVRWPGFIKKTQASPVKEWKLAVRRLKVYNSDPQGKEQKH